MKRFLALMLLLAGCSNGAAAEYAPRPFEADIKLVWCSGEYTGYMRREGAGSLYMRISGESLTLPVEYRLCDGGYSVAQGELSLSLPLESAPAAALPVMVERALLSIGGVGAKEHEGQMRQSSPQCELCYDKRDEKLISLSFSNGEVIFESFSFIEA